VLQIANLLTICAIAMFAVASFVSIKVALARMGHPYEPDSSAQTFVDQT
jgi:hypothetical protein